MSDQPQSNQLLGNKEDPKIDNVHGIAADTNDKSAPILINRQNRRYTIPPEEYCVIEDISNCNLDEQTDDIMQLDEGIDKISLLSSSSSSSSSSYFRELIKQLIANYPTEEQLADMTAENYCNYISELCWQEPSLSLSPPLLPPHHTQTTTTEPPNEQEDME
ncbi:unnamed protein product [Adineta steineri]|uniref:Uncharacterized protein n=1 Tax=Adineta steineri TaxID=433720 RepID=A0A819N6N1_9BILA|nr:unnamed protein product [Adineta steineri]CAF3992096.1 unnamed protein product [Adineta steineri]